MSQGSQNEGSNAGGDDEGQGQFSMPLTVDRLQVRRHMHDASVQCWIQMAPFLMGILFAGIWYLAPGHQEALRGRAAYD